MSNESFQTFDSVRVNDIGRKYFVISLSFVVFKQGIILAFLHLRGTVDCCMVSLKIDAIGPARCIQFKHPGW